ncbi:hypothetical protein FRC03_004316 [Tulasnella sp. 419]|nr:hypothetical protein FRC03_004316 [Tulasnella sp. 419]
MSQGSTTVTGNSRLSPKRASSPPQSPRSPLPWKGDLKGFQFLRIDPIVRLKDIGATAKRMVAGDDTLVFTTNTSAIMYDTTRKTHGSLLVTG